MPLYRSARLFTLGLALAGTCAAQDTQDNKMPHRQLKQQQREAVRKALATKPQKRAIDRTSAEVR
jgi:hypothetical protein